MKMTDEQDALRYRYLRDVAVYDSEVACLMNSAALGDNRVPRGGFEFLNGPTLDEVVDRGIELAVAREIFERT
jgi:hypothetical protein